MFAERRIFSVKPGGTYSEEEALKGGPCQSKRGYVGENALSDTQSRRRRRSVGVCRRFLIRE